MVWNCKKLYLDLQHLVVNTIFQVCTIGEVNRSLSKQLLGPILPTFTEALVAGLSLPDDSHASDPGLKTEILKALTILVRNVPKQMTPWMGQILPAVWATLTASAEKYVREVVNEVSQDFLSQLRN